MVQALEGVKNNAGLKFTFDNDDMDSLFNYVYENNVKEKAGEYIKKFYCTAKENNKWEFTVVGGWKAINTKVTMPATLEEKDNNLVFTFGAPILGRLDTSFAKQYIYNFAKSLKVNSLLQSPLQQLGIDGIKVDLEDTGSISIPKAGLMNYAMKFSKGSESSDPNELIKPLLSFFSQNSGKMINTETNKEIGIKLDMSDLKKRDKESGYVEPKRDLIDEFRGSDEKSLKGIIANVKAKAEAGEIEENKINDEITKLINSSNYKTASTIDNFYNRFKTKINNVTSLPLNASLDSVDIFDFMRTTSIVGKTTTFSKKINDKYSINNITIESLDVDFINDNGNNIARLYMPININGYTIIAILEYKISWDYHFDSDPDSSYAKITFGSEDISENNFYLGNSTITDTAKTEIINLLKNFVKTKEGGEIPNIKITDSGSIVFDVYEAFKDKASGTGILVGKTNVTMECQGTSENSCLKFSVES